MNKGRGDKMLKTMKKIFLTGLMVLLTCSSLLVVQGKSASAAGGQKAGSQVPSASAKLVHGTFTEYFKRVGINYTPVASQYENTDLNFSCSTNREPYPGLNPNTGFRVAKTAYIKIEETGTYRFHGSSSGGAEVYVNDMLVQSYAPVYLQTGQIVKVKVVNSFPTMSSSKQGVYSTDLYWSTPSAISGAIQPYRLIPQENIYTTPDLKGVDIEAPDKLVHGVFTEYEKRQSNVSLNFIPVASRYENATLDFSCAANKEPYPGINPSAGFQIKKTAYIKLTETGTYRFYATGSTQVQVYVDDSLVQNTAPLYLQAGQIIKVKTVAPYYTASQASTGRYFYDLRWLTPSAASSFKPYALIPQELLYTTPDLNGVPNN